MKLTPFEFYLRCLRVGKIRSGYVTREVAYDNLKRLTGQDFGLDVEKWRAWHQTQTGEAASTISTESQSPDDGDGS